MAASAPVEYIASERDAIGDVQLAKGEEFKFVTSRHWIVLIQRIIVPFTCALICFLIAVYRALGGSFLTTTNGPSEALDVVNSLLAVALGAILIGWIFARRRKRKLELSRQVIMLLAVAVIAALFWFRYQGGRVFSINRFTATPVDGPNIILFGMAIVFTLLCVYVFIDWSNDQLIITSQRVIIDDEVFLVRHVQDQVYIDDIQNVTASTNTYLQHWLNYGTIVIRSATANRQMSFHSANKPIETQKRIDGMLKDLRGQQSASQFRNMVEEKVYSTKIDKKLPVPKVQAMPLPFFLRWVLDCNPEVDQTKGTITWRPHWLFFLRSMLQPIGALLLALFLLILSVRLGVVEGGWLVFSAVAILAIFAGWSAWEIEDYRNDAYILEPNQIIDVQKKPFGPENRRTAGLGPVQNVNSKVTFVSEILGFGDVLVETAGSGGGFTFPRIPDAKNAAATINEYLAAFKKGEKERGLNDTLTLLRHYHNAQLSRHEIREENQPSSPSAPLENRPST